jgi:hypothetical protein
MPIELSWQLEVTGHIEDDGRTVSLEDANLRDTESPDREFDAYLLVGPKLKEWLEHRLQDRLLEDKAEAREREGERIRWR